MKGQKEGQKKEDRWMDGQQTMDGHNKWVDGRIEGGTNDRR